MLAAPRGLQVSAWCGRASRSRAPERSAVARKVLGQRCRARLARRLGAEVGELLALQQISPQSGFDSHLGDGSLGLPGCLVCEAENTPAEPDPGHAGEGRTLIRRCLTIAGSDSGGGAGIQADLKAFAARGLLRDERDRRADRSEHAGVTALEELSPGFVEAELEAVFSDIGVDAAKTGMLFSRVLIDVIADFLAVHRVPLVVDPVMVASSGAELLRGRCCRSAGRPAVPARDRRHAELDGGRGARRHRYEARARRADPLSLVLPAASPTRILLVVRAREHGGQELPVGDVVARP